MWVFAAMPILGSVPDASGPRRNHRKGPRRYPDPQPKPVGKSALHLFVLFERSRVNPERVELVQVFWTVGKKGAKKWWRCGCGGCNEFPRPHYPQFGCRQASTSPSLCLKLALPPCSSAFCPYSTQCPCHLSHLAPILQESESLRIVRKKILDDRFLGI